MNILLNLIGLAASWVASRANPQRNHVHIEILNHTPPTCGICWRPMPEATR